METKKNIKSSNKFLLLWLLLFTLLFSVLFSCNNTLAGSFSIIFFDVNQGDSSLIECDNHYMLIDGGKPDSSQKLFTYLKNNNINNLDYIVATHPDTDHCGGLAGALNYATADTALSPVTDDDSRAFKSFIKYLGSTPITVPSVGDTYALGSANFQIVGPISKNASDNNCSIVIRVDYGNTSFLFTGDAETEEEYSILDAGYNVRSDLIKIAHHGSRSSTSIEFLDAVNPSHAIISVGKDNSYGHPTLETLNKLQSRVQTLHRTDVHGDIVVTSDGTNINIQPSKNESANPYEYLPRENDVDKNSQEQLISATNNYSTNIVSSETNVTTTYILNTNTKKFHYPYCRSVNKMKEKNKREFDGTRDQAIADGYSPCGNCHP